MSLSPWLFLLVFSAVAIGWALGRFGPGTQSRRPRDQGMYRQYYRGLNYLLNDQPDEAIDAFIDSLDVNDDTLETHLAVGNLMRRKGEVERAIRIHQNLLARPSLNQSQLQQAHLELARDFMSAGLLDRAERLLQDLIQQSVELREISLRLLMEIYQGEREWQRAIDTAQLLLPRRSLLRPVSPQERSILTIVAQYHCELAEAAMAQKDYPGARAALKQALAQERDCARASLLLGRLELACGHYRYAVRALRRVRYQDPALLGELLQDLKTAYGGLGLRGEYREFLQECLAEYPSTTLLLAAVDDLRGHEGRQASLAFLAERLRQRPTLRGVSRLIELTLEPGAADAGSGELGEAGRAGQADTANIALLQVLVQQLLSIKPVYQCHHCGFSGRNLHWLCPSCKQWNTIRPIRGVEGD